MMASILLLASVGVATRHAESAERSNLYQQLCWPAQGKLHVLSSDKVSSNRFQWQRREQALPDLTPATRVASSVWQNYRGVAWPAEGKIHFYFARDFDFMNWTRYDIEQPNVTSSTNLVSGRCSRYHLISWPGQGKMHMLWQGKANEWHEWKRVEYSEHIDLDDLTPDSPVTTVVTDNYHGVAWPAQGKIVFLEEDVSVWGRWRRAEFRYPDLTPHTILGSDGTADGHLVAWPAEGKLHLLSRNIAKSRRWTKWESGFLPDLGPTSPVTVSVSDQVRAVYWPGQGKIHVFFERIAKWGDWKHYEMVQPDVSIKTRLGSGSVEVAGALQRACASYIVLLMTIASFVSSLYGL
eukprot:TRINITY_DN49711_c0_g1_i1.p1 TRINITY_DN49711_c0_g1~~TRINITY_DN49711_c0_g1_i1.p1  ORF type:complete len:371 (-),score=11.17 TRINITY_DN49711_c0_g1_i1:25-1077(-)